MGADEARTELWDQEGEAVTAQVFEFVPWPKTPRLNRDIVITEKIDGTNACIVVSDDGTEVGAQSRNRLITPEADNGGFARWVYSNSDILIDILGPGHHFGEWWGSGIQRGYGLSKGEKRFSLFNTSRWADVDFPILGLGVVPTLYTGPMSMNAVWDSLEGLRSYGSAAAPGFDRPEGVVLFHTAANQTFKVLLENDDMPKGVAA